MKIICIFLIFILNADFSLSSEPTAYNYTGYSAKYMNKSINSTDPMIQQSESDSSALLYVNHRKNNDYYSSMDYTVKETTIQKEGISTNLENSLSYCINSAVLNSGLKISLRKVSVYTKSEGAIGICVTNEGDVRVSESSVSTQSKNSIAIHASGVAILKDMIVLFTQVGKIHLLCLHKKVHISIAKIVNYILLTKEVP